MITVKSVITNEYGREIKLLGLRRPSSSGVCDHVLLNIAGPDSTTQNTITVEEARALRQLLTVLVGDA